MGRAGRASLRICVWMGALLLSVPALGQSPGDADGDGVPDRVDRCPHEPESPNGVHDDDGCPEPDFSTDYGTAADHGVEAGQASAFARATLTHLPPMVRATARAVYDDDSLRAREDSCPAQAEDEDGFQDGDGCPDPDNDGDGILDVEDRCPLVAEDADGHQDDDGCPEASATPAPPSAAAGQDSDGDGLPDGSDRCPQEAEDLDGYADHDGCPEAADGAGELAATGDADGDGVHDLDDLCPQAREDLDGFEDRDGCPDRDNDQDGVPDRVDRCPEEAEAVNGLHDADGCPDGGNDLDNDLVDDRWDICPLEPEDRDGVRDEDGCPEPAGPGVGSGRTPQGDGPSSPAVVLALLAPPRGGDVDGDGLSFYEDDCPDEAEDPDGVLDGDGCPDLDDDADGIADEDDRCPLEAETLNGWADEDGCPDDVLDAVSGIQRGIAFGSGSTTLLNSSSTVLKKIADLMVKYPEISLTIVGFTDDRGDADRNVRLSKSRADAVAAYLARSGVGRARIQTEGLGPVRPIASNDTDEGRAANRRVELAFARRETP